LVFQAPETGTVVAPPTTATNTTGNGGSNSGPPPLTRDALREFVSEQAGRPALFNKEIVEEAVKNLAGI
jgi:hypothetical protein